MSLQNTKRIMKEAFIRIRKIYFAFFCFLDSRDEHRGMKNYTINARRADECETCSTVRQKSHQLGNKICHFSLFVISFDRKSSNIFFCLISSSTIPVNLFHLFSKLGFRMKLSSVTDNIKQTLDFFPLEFGVVQVVWFYPEQKFIFNTLA